MIKGKRAFNRNIQCIPTMEISTKRGTAIQFPQIAATNATEEARVESCAMC